ncbi:MAG: hypothetical protein R3B54_02945 [Bdellovibrionota bacterium]
MDECTADGGNRNQRNNRGTDNGGIDIRPSVAPYGEAQFFTENTIEAGYKFSDKFSMGYVQGFYTNLHNHSKDPFILMWVS